MNFILFVLQSFGLICINVFYFGLLNDYSLSRWVCWGYIHATYALVIVAIYSVKFVHNGHVYAFPKIALALRYYTVVLILGIIMILINFSSIFIPCVVFLICTGSFFMLYLVLMATENHSIAREKKDSQDTFFIKRCAEQLNDIRHTLSNRVAQKQIERLYDAIRSSEVTSIPEVTSIESEITTRICAFYSLTDATGVEQLTEMVNVLLILLRKRDMEIRLSK